MSSDSSRPVEPPTLAAGPKPTTASSALNAVESGGQLGKHQSSPIRVGSPFATTIKPNAFSYQTAEEAVRREAALGGVIASGCLLLFAIPCIFWFPLGAWLIAPLGAATAAFGLYSRKLRVSMGFAFLHGIILLMLMVR